MARKTKPLTYTEIKAAKPKDTDYQLYGLTPLKTASTCWTPTLQIISMSSESWFIVWNYLTKLDSEIYEEGECNFGGSHK